MSKEYFTGLNYSLANEDNWIEHELAPEGARSMLSISGSGARAIPLLAKNPESLDIADLSQEQLYLSELRVAAIRALEYEEFLYFMGYRGGISRGDASDDSRVPLFERLKLSPPCREFWSKNQDVWGPHGFIYLGRWESHFMKLGKLLRRTTLLDARPLFSAHTIQEQRALYDQYWDSRRFYGFLRLALSDFVFNRYLYKGHYAGGKGRRTVREPAWELVHRELTQRFTETLLRKNFFLQMIFLGEVRHEEGLPPEGHPRIFQQAKASSTDVRFVRANFLELTHKQSYDFYSLSDTISYLAEEEARQFLSGIHPEVQAGTRIVIRSFMRQPELKIETPWSRASDRESSARARDCTGLYDFLVLSRD